MVTESLTKHLLILLAAACTLSGCGNGPPFCGHEPNVKLYRQCEQDPHCMLDAVEASELRAYQEKCGDR